MVQSVVVSAPGAGRRSVPSPRALLELLKPITWFATIWAFMCGVVSSGVSLASSWPVALAGMFLAGPMICATSQAANDWFDRHVDAINEPNRPIPSGRMPGLWGLWVALVWTVLSLGLASLLGVWVLGAAVLGLALAWAYSAPPFRLKQSGWWGPATVALCYEGLSWFTGASVMNKALPDSRILMLAGLYSFGAIGIMVLNDFKAIEGDQKMEIRSVPVELGAENAAWLSCVIMAAPQAVVIALLATWGRPFHALAVAVSLAVQCALMLKLLTDPRKYAPWYNATGISLYVLGMLASALAIGAILGSGH
jgi:chlorophyll synthase